MEQYTIYAYIFHFPNEGTYFYVGQTRRDMNTRMHGEYSSNFGKFLSERGISANQLHKHAVVMGKYPTPDYEYKLFDKLRTAHPDWHPLNSMKPQATKKHHIYLHAYRLNGTVYYYIGRTTRPNHRFTQTKYYGAFGQFIKDHNISGKMLKQHVNILEITNDPTREHYWYNLFKARHSDWVNLNSTGCSESWEDQKAKRKAKDAERARTSHYREVAKAKNARRSQFARQAYGCSFSTAWARGLWNASDYKEWLKANTPSVSYTGV